jgi:hypothetical protein
MNGYRAEFPDLDADGAAKIDALLATGGWEDTSWHNEPCPRLLCDVFELFIDYADASVREFPEAARFSMHDEGRVVLETDDWADVLAFINDGKRDFPDYQPA